MAPAEGHTQHSSTDALPGPPISQELAAHSALPALQPAETSPFTLSACHTPIVLATSNTNGAGSLPAAAVVAGCALLFTIGSFWWLNARQGKLKSYAPHSFAAAATRTKTLIRIPLVLFNTGPKPIIVQNLRLVLKGAELKGVTLPWSTTRDRIRPEKDDDPRLPGVFVVNGRVAEQVFAEFSTPYPYFIPELQEYQAVVECKLGHKKEWLTLVDFPIRLGNITSPANYIPYSNEPQELTIEERAKAASALESLRPESN
ncbi:hypothetical protein [Streptomyces sp. SID8499]|uniref:hypothetical protein n=1 Tax=Streptomyces sp. SID8499 TaxID=2706106 RepID=UPI0013C6C253|nr:hypothetical protein [Streptomyces sp. SID8499]NED34124.1 hypothetical protein [Streptomyces sp. SID8499]